MGKMTAQEEFKENTWLLNRYFPFNVFKNSSNSNSVLYLHWHDHIEIIYMIEGQAVFDIGNQSVEAGPGDILFVNSGQLHSGYSVDDTSVKYYAVVFNQSLLGSNIPDPYHDKYISPFLEGKFQFPVKIENHYEGNELFKSHIERIIDEFNCKMPGYEIKIKAILYLMTVDIFRGYLLSTIGDNYDIAHEHNIENIKRLISYVQQAFPAKITIREAARYVNLSPYYFCKVFKKVTGKTFIEFLNLYKIKRAENLLRNTSLSITQIAEELGFCNINYFDRIFKQLKKYSPSRYRKQ